VNKVQAERKEKQLEIRPEKQGKVERKAAKRQLKAAAAAVGKQDQEVVKRTKTDQLGTTSRKNTAQLDATPTEGLAKPSPPQFNDVHRSNGKKPERVPKRKAADVDASASSGTPVQRVSPHGIAKATAGAASVTSQQTRARIIPASDDSHGKALGLHTRSSCQRFMVPCVN
jgi:hypothetical protein